MQQRLCDMHVGRLPGCLLTCSRSIGGGRRASVGVIIKLVYIQLVNQCECGLQGEMVAGTASPTKCHGSKRATLEEGQLLHLHTHVCDRMKDSTQMDGRVDMESQERDHTSDNTTNPLDTAPLEENPEQP